VGLIAIVLVVIGFYLAFNKSLPFLSGGYEVKAVVKNAQNIAVKSPVRIAGVNVGTVSNVESVTDANGNGAQASIVTMRITDAGRPVHTDAKVKLRPRLFLEGNLFVDMQPGSPSAPEAPDGFTIPLQHTSNSVQVDQVLTSLQADTRQNLQTLLQELGDAFVKYGGDEGLRTFFKTSAVANKSTAQVSEAFLGTEPDDLSNLVLNLDRTVAGLGQEPAELQGLVSSLSTVTGSFAAQSAALETSIALLPQVLSNGRRALVSLNAMFPSLRAFARDLLPGVRSAGPALDAANPWVYQLAQLFSKPELRGLANDLSPTIPQLARLSAEQPAFFEQARALSSCFNNVVIPWADDAVTPSGVPPGLIDPAGPPLIENTGVPVYKETGYGLVGLAGESRSGDANGQYIRVEAGGGSNTVVLSGGPPGSGIDRTVGVTPYPLLGYEPAIASSAKSPFRPDIPCETQEPPDLGAGGLAPPPPSTGSRSRSLNAGDLQQMIANGKVLSALLNKQNKEKPKGKQAATLEKEIAAAFKKFTKEQPTGKEILGGGK
jgi:ABC-type transporter Mla subunit MlaD